MRRAGENRFWLAAVLALTASSLIAGCGSGSGGDETSAALTKAEFVKRGNAICTEAMERRDETVGAVLKRQQKAKNLTQEQSAKQLLAAAYPAIGTMTEKLAELSPPSGEEEQVERIVSGFEEGLASAEENPTRIIEGVDPLARTSEEAQRYGLVVCAQI